MTIERVKELLRIEQNCIHRAVSGCGRRCDACDLVQDDRELLEAYDVAIDTLDLYWAC